MLWEEENNGYYDPYNSEDARYYLVTKGGKEIEIADTTYNCIATPNNVQQDFVVIINKRIYIEEENTEHDGEYAIHRDSIDYVYKVEDGKVVAHAERHRKPNSRIEYYYPPDTESEEDNQEDNNEEEWY